MLTLAFRIIPLTSPLSAPLGLRLITYSPVGLVVLNSVPMWVP